MLLQLKIQDRKGRKSEKSGWCTSGIVAEKGSRRLKQLCRQVVLTALVTNWIKFRSCHVNVSNDITATAYWRAIIVLALIPLLLVLLSTLWWRWQGWLCVVPGSRLLGEHVWHVQKSEWWGFYKNYYLLHKWPHDFITVVFGNFSQRKNCWMVSYRTQVTQKRYCH